MSLNKYANKFAIPGDIVLARVGSSVVGKVGIVKEGFFVPTDCLIIIRVHENLRDRVFSLLKSINGQEWIHAHTKGVAAQHITIEDIKNFPINIKDTNNV
jgi:type I restriction enzyme M protein